MVVNLTVDSSGNIEPAPGELVCANPACRLPFIPIRITQRFHDPECRKAYWAVAYKWTPHPCPLCTVIHDPDERPVLDALEMLLAPDDALVLEKIEALIKRRRAILAGAGHQPGISQPG